MKLAVVGAGYVGLVTSTCLAEIGHHVRCIDQDVQKILQLTNGQCPIYEPNLVALIKKNRATGKLIFTTDDKAAFTDATLIFIAVGTPENPDGSVNTEAVEQVAKRIAQTVTKNTVVAIKSTVPVGTNDRIQQLINEFKPEDVIIDVVSNPEFLKEGSAIQDFFHGDRIVIGASTQQASRVVEKVYEPFGQTIVKTDLCSAEMMKYASNAFLATKISFINEIATICEKVGADVEQVAAGIGFDQRIGQQFLQAEIGYGGSCFPKDTNALIQTGDVAYDFDLLKGVVNINQRQTSQFLTKVLSRLGTVENKKIAVLGLALKPNTNDMRQAPSIPIIHELINRGAQIVAYDPVATEKAKSVLPASVQYVDQLKTALQDADAALILTDWKAIKKLDITVFHALKTPLVFDGRNCFSLEKMKRNAIEYHSVGRAVVELDEVQMALQIGEV